MKHVGVYDAFTSRMQEILHTSAFSIHYHDLILQRAQIHASTSPFR